jgi:hypothetical protein
LPTAQQLTIETVNLDDRVRAEIKELQQKGLLDAQGKPARFDPQVRTLKRRAPPGEARAAAIPSGVAIRLWRSLGD